MQQTFLDTPVEHFQLGEAKIQVQDGHWTFNNKPIKNCKFPVQQLVENFIKTCAFRHKEVEITSRGRSYSVIATRETVHAHAHLKAFNYKFPPTKEETIKETPVMDMFPEFIPKEIMQKLVTSEHYKISKPN